jgi:hypothetical protein
MPQDIKRATTEIGIYIACTLVIIDGRIELLQY